MSVSMATQPAGRATLAVKILVAGGFGAGKSTLVSAVSEVRPLRTEEVLSDLGREWDAGGPGAGRKTTTTVAMDFGRISVDGDIILYLFGTPGQERFRFIWDELALGALGAVVLADTGHLDACFAALDYFERQDTPFLVAVNCFDGVQRHSAEAVRRALDLEPDSPVMLCDARDRRSVKDVLVALVEHVLERRYRTAAAPAAPQPTAEAGMPGGSAGRAPDGPESKAG